MAFSEYMNFKKIKFHIINQTMTLFINLNSEYKVFILVICLPHVFMKNEQLLRFLFGGNTIKNNDQDLFKLIKIIVKNNFHFLEYNISWGQVGCGVFNFRYQNHLA